MSAMTENLLIIEALTTHTDRLQALLGDGWFDFQKQLHHWLAKLAEAEDDDQVSMIVDEIIELGLESSAAELVRALLGQASNEAGHVDNATRSVKMYDPTSGQTRDVGVSLSGEVVADGETRSANRADVVAAGKQLDDQLTIAVIQEVGEVDSSVTGAKINNVAGDEIEDFIGDSARDVPVGAAGRDIQQIKLSAQPRYLQSSFISDHSKEVMTEDSPLALDGGPYTLQIVIGPGEGDVPWPDEVLQEAFETGGKLRLPVRVTSLNLGIISLNKDDALYLEQQGFSTSAQFQVIPQTAGRARLNVDVFYRGNLLQRQQVQVAVVEKIGQPVLESARPPQTRQIVYTIAGSLSEEALARWEERVMHITAEREQQPGGDGSYVFLFRKGHQDLFTHDSDQTDLSLARLIPVARVELAAAAEAYQHQPAPETARPLLERWLPLLAYQGTRLYEAILLNADPNPVTDLTYGSVIQISPIGQRATLPWGLVYDRPMLADRGSDKEAKRTVLTNPVCPDWLAGHDCLSQGCPQATEATIVCPSGFWGYRFIIEQIPAGLGAATLPEVSDLPHLIDNCSGTRFNMNVFTDFDLWQEEAAVYQAYEKKVLAAEGAPFTLLLADNRPTFDAEMQRAVASRVCPHVIYFYAHGGHDDQLGVYLRLGRNSTTDYITLPDFRGLGLTRGALVSRPLVFLNACESADYTPDAYGSFIARFHAAGACGLVGTECSVWERTARAVAVGFFRQLFDGIPAGEALWQTSLDLLANYNPLGLTYTLFASSLTRLVCRV